MWTREPQGIDEDQSGSRSQLGSFWLILTLRRDPAGSEDSIGLDSANSDNCRIAMPDEPFCISANDSPFQRFVLPLILSSPSTSMWGGLWNCVGSIMISMTFAIIAPVGCE